MSTIAKAYVQIIPSTDGIGDSLKKAMDSEASSAGESAGKKLSGAIGSGLAKGTALIAKGTVAASGALTKLAKDSVAAFGEFEQLKGGVETLFGDSAQAVMDNANRAFETAGLSANQYMETVTSFSASLLQSVGGDTEKAAQSADMAIQDMSDNANKMGTSMESIQNAYQGFAKQNYTMLDNLKLGYGGTKSEMERLLKDAEEFSGVKYDISSLSDVYDAIHVIQGELGITGTTALEASTTIQGSMSMLKSSWTNVISAMGTDGADLSGTISTFIESAQTFAGNLMPVIQTALTGISQLITQLAPVIASTLPALISECLPGLLDAGFQVIQALGNGIVAALPELIPAIVDIVMAIGNFLIENLPLLIESAFQIILQLGLGIAQALPTLIPEIVNIILTIAQYLIENIDLLLDAAFQIIVGLGQGLIAALPVLIEKVPVIMTQLKDKFIALCKTLLIIGYEVSTTIKNAISEKWNMILSAVSGWITNLKNKFIEKVQSFISVGSEIVNGIKQGIANAWDSITSWFSDKVHNLVQTAKEALSIGSPSKVFANEVGKWIPAGVAQGIQKNIGLVQDAISDMSMLSVGTAFDNISEYGLDLGKYALPVAESNKETSGYNQTINVYSPKSLSASEVARQTKIATQNMVLALRGV